MAALLALLPVVASLVSSFSAPGGRGAYALMWGTSRGWQALWDTVRLSSLAGAIAVVIAWAAAAGAVRLPVRWAALSATLCCLPLLVPSSLLATAWIVALGEQGLLTSLARSVWEDWRWTVFNRAGAAAVLALRYFGVAVLVLTHHRFQQRRAWVAERAFAIPRWAAWVHLHARPAGRPVVAAWLLVMLLCMNDHIIPDMLLVPTYGTQVLIQYSALLDPAGAAALAAPMGLVCAAMVLGAIWLARAAWTRSDDAAEEAPPTSARSLLIAASGLLAVLALALAVPVGVLACRVPSWAALGQAWQDAREQAAQTFRVCLAVGSSCSLLAWLVAACWLRQRRGGRRSLAPLVLLNLCIPPSLLAIGVVELAAHWPLVLLRDTAWPLIAACVARFLPVAVLVLYAAWRDRPPLPGLAAAVHGVACWRTAIHIHWPAQRLALLTTALLCGVLAATELEVSTLLAPPGGATLGVRLATLIHTASDAAVSALALDILGAVAVPMVLVTALMLGLFGRRKTP